ncbi:ABC transporter permease [Pantoea rodasii]|uniref:ABC transporter permease n=1 Tax=Pantoea rodasii TaxID=1076549 RepID=A0A2M9WEC0_9GAMM|nr:ABC transporter permease [Pantoea rodasii]ORM57834.1 ABC transporter permease [Pantoea rodasii]PJZ05894.1 ABC transporter permease [Pantoea rodasii]
MSDVIQPAHVDARERVRRRQWLQHVSLIIIIGVLAVFAWLSPIFLTLTNLGNVLQQTAVVGTLALGLTLVLSGGGVQGISGGIDLSVAANLGLSAAVFATLIAAGQPISVALLLTLATGAAVGLFNAFAIVWLGILPLLATLTSMNIALGLEMVLTGNASVSASSDLQNSLIANGPFNVSWLGWAFLLLAFIAIALSRFTAFGIRLQAVGSHPHAANAAGIGVKRYRSLSYVFCGISAALAAVASVSLLSGSSPGANDNLLMVIAAALLGVVFSRRLVPTLGGALISAFFLSLIANGFQLVNISSYWINGVEGVLIIFVVALTALLRRRQQRGTQGV